MYVRGGSRVEIYFRFGFSMKWLWEVAQSVSRVEYYRCRRFWVVNTVAVLTIVRSSLQGLIAFSGAVE